MSKLTVVNSLTLDGVMQAPGRPDEDPRGGFSHGGWAVPYSDEVGRLMGERIAGYSGGMLFGRRTYEDFFGFWPRQGENPFTKVLNDSQKYVASRTLKEPLPWSNSTLLAGDAGQAVARLKQERPDQDLTVLGSGDLIQTLLRHDLIDQYLLLIHPLILGTGRRMFPDGGPVRALRLLDSVTTSNGVVIATYQATSSSA